MKIAIIRGSYLNKYEMQNYESLDKRFKLTGFGGLTTIHNKFNIPLIRLPSPADFPALPKKMAILNRVFQGDAMYLLGLENKLKGFDIAHVRETYFHFTQQALEAKKRGHVKKVVCTCSETIPFNHEGIRNRKKFKTRALKEIDIFHCLTEKAKNCLIKEGSDSKKIVVFPYGIDLRKFTEKKKESSERIKLLSVCRLVEEKGVFELLKTFKLLAGRYNNLSLNIIGNGPAKGKMNDYIESQGLDRFIKIKTICYSLIQREYQSADIFCLFSKKTQYWEEYFGMALIEAMASGLPIVASRSGAIEEVVGECGLLADGNINNYFKALKGLIDNKMQRVKLGLKGIKKAKLLYDSTKVAKKLENLYEKAWKNNG